MKGKTGRKAIDIDPDEMLLLYESGMSLMKIAKKIGVSETFVLQRLKKHPLYQARKRASIIEKVDKDELLEMYNSGLSQKQIADKLGFSQCTVRKFLSRNPKYKAKNSISPEERLGNINEQLEVMDTYSLTLIANILDDCDIIQVSEVLGEIALLPESSLKKVINILMYLTK